MQNSDEPTRPLRLTSFDSSPKGGAFCKTERVFGMQMLQDEYWG